MPVVPFLFPGVPHQGWSWRGGEGGAVKNAKGKKENCFYHSSPLSLFPFSRCPLSYPRGQKYSVISALSKLFLFLFFNEFNFSNSQLYCNWGCWYPLMRTNLKSVHAILHHLHNHVVFTFSCIRRFFRVSVFLLQNYTVETRKCRT